MSNESADRWQEWVDKAAAAVGVDAGQVDIGAIHELTKVIAHEVDRPLAPVSSFMLGLAIGQQADADPAELRRLIEETRL